MTDDSFWNPLSKNIFWKFSIQWKTGFRLFRPIFHTGGKFRGNCFHIIFFSDCWENFLMFSPKNFVSTMFGSWLTIFQSYAFYGKSGQFSLKLKYLENGKKRHFEILTVESLWNSLSKKIFSNFVHSWEHGFSGFSDRFSTVVENSVEFFFILYFF